MYYSYLTDTTVFQLHHTGIKTYMGEDVKVLLEYFNCTIQELKPSLHRCVAPSPNDFNCTIQELKHVIDHKQLLTLHHFNCTIQELKRESCA